MKKQISDLQLQMVTVEKQATNKQAIIENIPCKSEEN
jgi:hypothetical protein